MKTKKITHHEPQAAALRKTEYCVLCGAATAYTTDTPIDQREHYIVGAGQLCRSCAQNLEKESNGTYVEDC